MLFLPIPLLPVPTKSDACKYVLVKLFLKIDDVARRQGEAHG
jgi:hypothetical protein